jgi:TfoX/Sxy family transcriptional regulator of competence genes
MAYDEGLAERIREVFAGRPDVAEKKMFGGVAFMVRGHMCVGIVRDELMVRVKPESYETLLREPFARAMDFTGRPMKGFLFVAPGGIEDDESLERWIATSLDHATTLSAQSGTARRSAAAKARKKR